MFRPITVLSIIIVVAILLTGVSCATTQTKLIQECTVACRGGKVGLYQDRDLTCRCNAAIKPNQDEDMSISRIEAIYIWNGGEDL